MNYDFEQIKIDNYMEKQAKKLSKNDIKQLNIIKEAFLEANISTAIIDDNCVSAVVDDLYDVIINYFVAIDYAGSSLFFISILALEYEHAKITPDLYRALNYLNSTISIGCFTYDEKENKISHNVLICRDNKNIFSKETIKRNIFEIGFLNSFYRPYLQKVLNGELTYEEFVEELEN